MHSGLYTKALAVLGRKYPAVPADQSEPESVLPQNHPLVLYYAAYCEAKLGKGCDAKLAGGEEAFANYVFPSSAMDEVVLEAALSANTSDATAHYLLGTLLFSKG